MKPALPDNPAESKILSEVQIQSFRKILASLHVHYNRKFLENQQKMDSIFTKAGMDKLGKNRLAEIKNQVENQQIAHYLAEDFILQPPLLLTKNGIVRKEKPVYHIPENKVLLDFRTHQFAPYKPFLGELFHTEFFNVLIIWSFILVNLFFLRFRWLRKILRIHE
jgi:hypothetical protein